ncbi:MAG: hypothetical protein HP494_02880 [Nitrospira sp.]|nr:hypothetical protein [Nitrospira sp.]
MAAGVRIDHPRISDLAFWLVSPQGTRVLLCENRGGDTAAGMMRKITLSNLKVCLVPFSSFATLPICFIAP